MGQAKLRGTKEQRVKAALDAGRVIDRQRTKPYRNVMPRGTSMLEYLWGQFKVVGDRTINEIRAEAVMVQKAAAARRAAQEQTAAYQGTANESQMKSNAQVIEEMLKGPARAPSLSSDVDTSVMDLING
jgi:hypothetical protein